MNIKQFPFHLGLGFTFALAFITCQTSQPASAQYNGQTDVTGVIVTTGDITGGTFNQNPAPTAVGTTTDFSSGSITTPAVGRNLNIQRAVFAKSSLQFALNQTALNIFNQLNTNSLTSQTGQSIPSATQQTLLSVLIQSRGGQKNTATEQITKALSSVEGGPTLEQVQQLANSLQGLLEGNRGKKVAADGGLNAIQLLIARNAYNNLINNSSAQFLNNPPPELTAIQSILLPLINSVSAR
ncbi:hypothetical protein NIES2107_36290 [Nostoc carneum NIES-2107]|nr:hypothetical protein NIES2107_36290 [Nostoc carneum NIES-2107]